MLTPISAALQPNASLVTNTSSQNRFPAVNLMTYHLDTTSNRSSLAKRDESRLMNECTTPESKGKTFERSQCGRHGTLQTVLVFCHNPDDPKSSDYDLVSCARNEFCINTGTSFAKARAYCVSTNVFRKVHGSVERQIKTLTIFNPGAQVPGLEVVAAAALLTDGKRKYGVSNANLFQLYAIGPPSDVATRDLSTDVVKKEERCVACFTLRMEPLPKGTDILVARVDIRSPDDFYIFLITIS